MGVLQVSGIRLIGKFRNGFIGLQVVVKKVFGKESKIKLIVRNIKSWLKRQKRTIIKIRQDLIFLTINLILDSLPKTFLTTT